MTTPPPEHVAVHEAGHAAAWAALGLEFGRVSLETSPPGVYPLPGWSWAQTTLGAHFLAMAAGGIADYQSRQLIMRSGAVLTLLTGQNGDTFAMHNADGRVEIRPSRALAVAEGGDLYFMSGIMTEDRWPAALIISIWRDIERFTAALRPVIAVVAAELLERGTLGYERVSGLTAAALPGMPAAPPWVSWVPGGWLAAVAGARL